MLGALRGRSLMAEEKIEVVASTSSHQKPHATFRSGHVTVLNYGIIV